MSRIKKFLVIGLGLLPFLAVAQDKATTSPYSRYGFGSVGGYNLARNFSMGGFGIAYASENQVNLANPATISLLRSKSPVFDIGLRARFLELNGASGASEVNTDVAMRDIVFAFPLADKGAFTFGIMPFSNVGYDISAVVAEDSIGDVTYNYSGNGGVTNVFFGGAYRIIDKGDQLLSVGATGSYLFGSLNKVRKAVFEPGLGYVNTRLTNTTTVGDFTADLGVYYSSALSEKVDVHVGAIYNVGAGVNAEKSVLNETYVASGEVEIVKDTVEFSNGEKGEIVLPNGLGFGVAFDYKFGSAESNRVSRLRLGGEYYLKNWSNYSESFGGTTVRDVLNNSVRYTFAAEYTPQIDKSVSANYFSLIDYRMGLRYSFTSINIEGAQVEDLGISFGVSLPFVNSFSRSVFNLGAEMGKRGDIESTLINERYVTLFFGFSIMPDSRTDKWFNKRKYD